MPDLTSPEAGVPARGPRQSKTELLKSARDRIDVAKSWRKSKKYEDTWKRLVDLYSGKQFESISSSEDQIAVNLCFATINVIGPSIATNYPKITVSARAPETDPQAAIAEAVLNYWWRHYDLKPEFRRAVDDFLILGHGWLKVGYRYKERLQERPEEDINTDFQELSAQLDEFAAANPEQAGDLPTEQEVIEGIDPQESVVLEDRPFVERVSPWEVYVDPEATCVADMRWIAQRVIRPLDEVRKDPRYPRAARRRLKADGSIHREWSEDDRDTTRRDSVARVTIWEFYDLQAETIAVFSELGDEFLVAPQAMPYSYGHPFVMLRNYDVPDCFYPIGELEMLEPLQHELNKTRSQLASYRRKQARKYLYRKSAFGPEGQSALASNNDNTLVPVESDDDFDRLVAPLKQDAMDGQLYQYSDTIEDDFDRISGIPEYMRGGLPEVRRTATEASIIQDAANARSANKLAIVEDAIKEVAERLLQLAQQYMTGDQVVRVVGEDGQNQWVQYGRKDIMGEFDFEVEAGSTQPRNETFRRQQAMQLMDAMAPLMGTVVDPIQLAQHVLREGFGIKNPERFIMQQLPIQPDPNAPEDAAPPPEEEVPPAPNDQFVGAPTTLPQLEGQVGLNVGNLGGGALGPGAA